MSTSTAPTSRSRTANAKFLDARGAAALFDMSRPNWYRFARNHNLQPELTDPARWRRTDLVLWKASIPTLESIEKSGEWVCRRNSGYCTEVFWHWHKKGLLKAQDYKKIVVYVTYNERTEIRDVTFYRRCAIDQIFAANKTARSEKLKDHWEKLQEISDQKGESWLLSGGAAEFLGITEATLGIWSDKARGGCPYLVGRRPLKTTDRFSPHRRWALSSLMAAADGRDDWPAVSDHPDVYSPEETRRLTGIGRKTLKSTKKSLARGLVRVLVPVITKRGDHLLPTKTAAFTKDSVDKYVADKKSIPAHQMKTSDAARYLGIAHATVLSWWREGILTGGFVEYDTAGNGRIDSILIDKDGLKRARAALSAVRGNAQAAHGILQAQASGAGIPDYRVPADRMTTTQVVDALDGPCRETVITWCEEGLLEGESRTFAPSTACLTEGWLITKQSVKTARKVLESVNGNVKEAARELRAMKGLPIWTKPRNDKVEEVLAYIYGRWMNGDALKEIRDGAEAKFGPARAPKRSTKITSMAKEYARRHSLPTDRKREEHEPADPLSLAAQASEGSSTGEPMRSAAHVGARGEAPLEPVEPKTYDQDYRIKDEEHIAATRENGKKLDRIADHLEILLPTGSREFLKRPNIVVRNGQEVPIAQRLWHLLGVILDANREPVALGEAGEAIAPGKEIQDKSVMNAVSELNTALLQFKLPDDWPDTYRVKGGHIVTEAKRP